MQSMTATELTAEERVALGLLAVCSAVAPDFSAADWDDRNSSTWTALAELSETDPVTTGHLIDSWRRNLGRSGHLTRKSTA